MGKWEPLRQELTRNYDVLDKVEVTVQTMRDLVADAEKAGQKPVRALPLKEERCGCQHVGYCKGIEVVNRELCLIHDDLTGYLISTKPKSLLQKIWDRINFPFSRFGVTEEEEVRRLQMALSEAVEWIGICQSGSEAHTRKLESIIAILEDKKARNVPRS